MIEKPTISPFYGELTHGITLGLLANFMSSEESQEVILAKLRMHIQGLTEYWDYEDLPTLNAWSLADLFLIQHIVHGCDGSGLSNVSDMYAMLTREKATLVKYKMISEKGWNSKGEQLWSNYQFDVRVA